MRPRMRYDDVAWEKSEEISDGWVSQFFEPDILGPVGTFLVKQHRPDDPVEFTFLEKGGFNISFRMEYKNGGFAVIRFPQPGAAMFPEEKVRNEVAVMRYIYDQTSIPVPFVVHWGSRDASPLKLGPFIVMDYIAHDTSMYHLLNRPDCPRQERGTLDPAISEVKLETLYGEFANVLIQLSKPSFSRIGALAQIDDFTWEVTHRPLSMPMNTLVGLGSLPRSKLPQTTFSTSSYFEALAELHLAHLVSQRNDAIDSADDCRRKFVSRYLFRKLAHEKRLTEHTFDKGPFKLWCDDLRPANVLMSTDMKITGVVDWEFTYAAPVEFSYSPPWWLLIERPEYWPQGLEDWCQQYERRLQTFLKAMKFREDEAIKEGWLKEEQRLSGPMRSSWERGDFWITYASRNNFAFDLIYWYKIDGRFFSPITGSVEEVWRQRLDLLEPGEREEMEKYVALKVQEMDDRVLAWDPDDYTKEFAKTMTKEHEKREFDSGEDKACAVVEAIENIHS